MSEWCRRLPWSRTRDARNPTPTHRLALLLAFVVALAACRARESSEMQVPRARAPATPVAAHPKWAVNPARAGPDRPPAGQSLFDRLFMQDRNGRRTYDIPFPFDALLARINARAGCSASAPCVRVVMIPLGRSLQRMTASPAFFEHPRVVAAVDAEGNPAAADAMLLKDRLYLGYQDKAALIEVISYNEAAGRFEFQLVHDYRAGATPRVSNGHRDVCAACHQNLAPIFSRPLWAETNANPRVAALLTRDAFFGIPVHRGVDIPAAIDAATDRANLFAVWQRLWRDACGPDDAMGRQCRGAAVIAALQYRLGDERGFDESAIAWRERALPRIAREWQAHWPAGLAIPNPDLPNRDPLPAAPVQVRGSALAHVPARFEPLQPRTPLDVWSMPTTAPGAGAPAAPLARRFVAGLGGFFSQRDLRELDRHLRARSSEIEGARRSYEADCTLQRTVTSLRFTCGDAATMQLDGHLLLHGTRVSAGALDTLALPGQEPLHYIDVEPTALATGHVTLTPGGGRLPARLTNGSLIESIELRWTGPSAGQAATTVRDDFAPMRSAMAALSQQRGPQSPLSARPFNASRLLAALSIRLDPTSSPACCVEAAPASVSETDSPTPAPPRGLGEPFTAFYPLCGGCHATAERTPPNFLAGSTEQVRARLRQCAPRLYARLAMWRRAPAQREKTPMPPPIPLAYPHIPSAPDGVEALEQLASGLLHAETGRKPQLDALLGNGYEALRTCLPAETQDASHGELVPNRSRTQ